MKCKPFAYALAALLCCLVIGGPAEALAAKKEKISIAAGRPGDAWNVLSYGLSALINERSEWLEAEVVATAGTADNTRLVQRSPEKRKNHIIVSMTPGMESWGGDEYQAKKIASVGNLASVWVTLDPNLKTFKDLKGKTLAMSRKGPGMYVYLFADILKQEGVWDTVKPMHGGMGACLTALQDGAAEAGYLMFDYIYPDTFLLGSLLEQLQTRGQLYYIQQGDLKRNVEMIGKAGLSEEYAKAPLPNLAMVVPAKALGPNQTEDMAVISTPHFWAASADVSDEIVYEVTRIIYEAAGKGDFTNFHVMGKGITPDFVVSSFWKDEAENRANHHSGALKYYDEKGIKLKSLGDFYMKK